MNSVEILMPAWKIKWLNVDAKGSVDFLPDFHPDLLTGDIYFHLTTIKGEEALSTCTIHGSETGLVYSYGGKCKSANQAAGIFCGDIMINYDQLENASTLSWRGEGNKVWTKLPVKIEKVEAYEGEVQDTTSQTRLRNKPLAALYRLYEEWKGPLKCEACGFEGLENYGEAKTSCLEVHHKRPLNAGVSYNTLENLILLCANCHRAVHALNEPYEKFLTRFSREEKRP